MKRLLLGVALLCLTNLSLAAGGDFVGIPSTMVTRNTATTPVGLLYTSQGSSIFTEMSGKMNFSIFNGSGTSLAVAVRSNECTSSTQDNFMVPANTGLVIEDIAMAKAFCARSISGNSITSGTILLSVW